MLCSFRHLVWAVGEQRLEELHSCGHHHGCIPVLHRQLQLLARLGLALRVVYEGAVVLEHGVVAERVPKNLGILLDDARVGDDVDDPVQTVSDHVLERESE
jgi:hypothetical protein